MTAAQKRVEADRLLASPARFVLVDQRWYARPGPPDPLLAALRDEFHPVRGYGTVLILERGNDPAWRAFAERLRAALARGPSPADVAAWKRFVADHPDEPIGHRILGAALESSGNGAGAIDAYRRAADLDSADVTPLERGAALLAQAGRGTEARADLERARRVRDSNALREVARGLGGDGIAP
jgi:tetratricopeptide (TPR) repeat protein